MNEEHILFRDENKLNLFLFMADDCLNDKKLSTEGDKVLY